MASAHADGGGGGTYKLRGISGRTFDPTSTALLVIDPVNDFLAEDGAAWELTESTVTKHDVIGHLRQLIDGVRDHGVPVLFGPMAYTADDYAHQELHRRTGINRICSSSRCSWPEAGVPTSINSVAPTTVRTPMANNGDVSMITTHVPELVNSLTNAMPVEAVDAEDVANAVAWLASDGARYVTGTVIPVDAGNINRR